MIVCGLRRLVIGITGNIGTGKTTVRRMLEDLGAFGIDADDLVHRALAQDGTGYRHVVRTFGSGILTTEEQIDRQKLADLVFDKPTQLAKLETILHPIVRQEIDQMVTQTSDPVIAVEAIKLIEGGLADKCDSVWLVQASREQQLERVTKHRRMSTEQAAQRMRAQTPQERKEERADVLINNYDGLEETRRQVDEAWVAIVSSEHMSKRASLGGYHH